MASCMGELVRGVLGLGPMVSDRISASLVEMFPTHIGYAALLHHHIEDIAMPTYQVYTTPNLAMSR